MTTYYNHWIIYNKLMLSVESSNYYSTIYWLDKSLTWTSYYEYNKYLLFTT